MENSITSVLICFWNIRRLFDKQEQNFDKKYFNAVTVKYTFSALSNHLYMHRRCYASAHSFEKVFVASHLFKYRSV